MPNHRSRHHNSHGPFSMISDGAIAIVAWVILEMLGARSGAAGRLPGADAGGYRMMADLMARAEPAYVPGRTWIVGGAVAFAALVGYATYVIGGF